MQHFANFGKVNLQNLQKMQKLDLTNTNQLFLQRSGLTNEHPAFTNTAMEIHDGLTHSKIKPSLNKYLPKVEYKERPQDFLHLNPSGKKDLADHRYNQEVEKIGLGIDGIGRKNRQPLTVIGNAIRKKELSPVEQLATQHRNEEVYRLRYYNNTPATQDDVSKVISSLREAAAPKRGRGIRKARGVKPEPQELDFKKIKLEGRYGI
jgi:hypothetical protein